MIRIEFHRAVYSCSVSSPSAMSSGEGRLMKHRLRKSMFAGNFLKHN